MPTTSKIQELTTLSRQTIHKHLNEYSDEGMFTKQIDQFKFMETQVLGKVLQLAMKGDVRAAKLYLTAIGSINDQRATHKTTIQNQNNYIQINGTILSQDTVKQLNPEQLSLIESILKDVVPQRVEVPNGGR